jgi:hypothetical protein
MPAQIGSEQLPDFFFPAAASFSAFNFSLAITVILDATSFASEAFKLTTECRIKALRSVI